MQRIVCEGKGNGEEQRADVLREKERSGRERKRNGGREGGKEDLPRKRSEGETADWLRSEPTSTR